MKKLAFALVGLMALSACETGTTQNRVVNINNNTGMTMTHFFASNSSMSTWGPEQLGPTTVLGSGRTTTIDFDDGTGACVFDFKARFNNDEELQKFGVNVCEISSYNYVR